VRILMISADPALADRGSVVFQRVGGYAEKAGEIVAVARTIEGSTARVSEGQLTVLPTGSRGKLTALLDLYRIGRRVARERGPFDVVTAQNPFEHGLVAWLVARAAHAPLELQAHTDFASPGFVDVSRGNWFRAQIARFLLPKAASVRAVSRRVADACRAVGARRVSAVPVRADVGALFALPEPEPYDGQGAFEIVTVSRLSAEKRIEELIESVRLLRERGLTARLTVIGDGPEGARLEKLAENLEQGSVIFLGRLSSPLARGRYHAYAQASAFEGYGLSLVEAAARGLPVVTTDVGLVGEVLVDGESCLVADGPEAFGIALAGLACNPGLAKSLGHAARQAAVRAEGERGETVVEAWAAAATRPKPRVLFVSQALDESDPVLGFVARWIEELAARVDSVVAVGLRRGSFAPPANVRTRSLGKGQGKPLPKLFERLRVAGRFLSIAWRERKSYDAVFVHMNEEYVLVAGWLWRILGKRVTMWRNHYDGTWKTKLAGKLCHEVFCTSAASYTARFPNARIMPVGVPLERFGAVRGAVRVPRSVLFLGRIAPSKNLTLPLEALAQLAAAGVDFRATFVGDPLPEHAGYAANLRERAATLGLADRIEWRAGVPNAETPEIYAAHEIFVNTSRSGMFDKTIFEAAASGCRLVYASDDARELFGSGHFPLAGGAPALAAALRASLGGEDGWDPARAKAAAEAHSLSRLMDELAERLS
jgi:glycosyltransferase involved in cell wall biosynthesis